MKLLISTLVKKFNNEQASIAVFTAAFCFAHAKHSLVKLKLLPALRATEIVECEHR